VVVGPPGLQERSIILAPIRHGETETRIAK
jgi:hypothetical protein